jgi:uncharacterized protein
MHAKTYWVLLTVGLWISAAGSTAQAQKITYPPKPGDRDFIVDEANLIAEADKAEIKKICDKLLTEKKAPILVVTINSMAQYGADGWDIRVFAQNLFNTWGVGFKDWNHGILLLVSKGDRKARIELGADWKGRKDAECEKIMQQAIVANFKAGRFSEGIKAGVAALEAMARGLKIPKPPAQPRPWWHYALVVGFVGLVVFTIVSLVRRGASGWAWLVWAAVFAVLGYLLYQLLTQSSRGGGGGWSGGSFGGGFSGGGGATGSW